MAHLQDGVCVVCTHGQDHSLTCTCGKKIDLDPCILTAVMDLKVNQGHLGKSLSQSRQDGTRDLSKAILPEPGRQKCSCGRWATCGARCYNCHATRGPKYREDKATFTMFTESDDSKETLIACIKMLVRQNNELMAKNNELRAKNNE